jgi:hypothetical protein
VHSVTVAVEVQEPFMLLDDDIGGDIMLLFEFMHVPYMGWQPAMQYFGPEPLFVPVSLSTTWRRG